MNTWLKVWVRPEGQNGVGVIWEVTTIFFVSEIGEDQTNPKLPKLCHYFHHWLQTRNFCWWRSNKSQFTQNVLLLTLLIAKMNFLRVKMVKIDQIPIYPKCVTPCIIDSKGNFFGTWIILEVHAFCELSVGLDTWPLRYQ